MQHKTTPKTTDTYLEGQASIEQLALVPLRPPPQLEAALPLTPAEQWLAVGVDVDELGGA